MSREHDPVSQALPPAAHRQGRSGVEPAFEARRHPGVERRHARGEQAGAVEKHAIAADGAEHYGDDALGWK